MKERKEMWMREEGKMRSERKKERKEMWKARKENERRRKDVE